MAFPPGQCPAQTWQALLIDCERGECSGVRGFSWNLQCSLGKVVNTSETSSVLLSDHMGALKQDRKTCKGSNWSPKSKAIISMPAMNTSIRIALGSLAVTHHSLEPLPGFTIGGNPERGVRRQKINFK